MSAAMALALVAATAWGAADFVGGVTGRRVPPLSVAFASQLVGLIALVVAIPFVSGALRPVDLAWGAGAGVGAAIGVFFLFRGLAVGVMSVVAPVTAVGAACIPVLFGILTGDRPRTAALAGMAVALVAVALLALFPADGDAAQPEAKRAGLLAGLVAGAGFGAFFVLLGQAGDGAGLWPLVGSRGTSVAVLGAAVLFTGGSFIPAGIGREVVLIGVLDVVANVTYLLATRRGLLSIVALLASLYPAATVVLARVVLRERLSPTQVAGLAGAGGAIVLIAAG